MRPGGLDRRELCVTGFWKNVRFRAFFFFLGDDPAGAFNAFNATTEDVRMPYLQEVWAFFSGHKHDEITPETKEPLRK